MAKVINWEIRCQVAEAEVERLEVERVAMAKRICKLNSRTHWEGKENLEEEIAYLKKDLAKARDVVEQRDHRCRRIGRHSRIVEGEVTQESKHAFTTVQVADQAREASPPLDRRKFAGVLKDQLDDSDGICLLTAPAEQFRAVRDGEEVRRVDVAGVRPR